MPTTSSLSRYSSYTSSYPSSYRSSYLNRTTSLDRSIYSPSTVTSPSYSSSGYYKRLSTLPPRPSYSSAIESSYRSSRNRVSPIRTSSNYSSRLASDSSVYDRDRDREPSATRYLSSSSRFRESSTSRDSGYSSRFTSRDRSYDKNPETLSSSRRGSLVRASYDADNDEESVRVSDRIRAFEVQKDPAEERLALRRQRLGLTPQRETKSRSRNVSISLDENNTRNKAEENGNAADDDLLNRSISDLCKKYDSNLNLSNGYDTELSSLGCSGGATSSLPKSLSGDVGVEIKSTDSKKKEISPSIISSSPKSTSSIRSKSPSNTLDSGYSSKSSTLNGRISDTSSRYGVDYDTLSYRTRDRRDRVRDRIAKRLASEVEDGESPPSRRRSPTGSSSDSFSEANGLVGLRNIGNTCFLNSIVQCLSNTPCLMEYLIREGYSSDINTTLSTMKGDLLRAFASLLSDMWREGASDTHTPLNTGSFKSQIQRFAPVFIGYAQHDAQEFLRKLLEGLHEDVNRVTVRPRPITDDIDDLLDDNQKAMESWKRYLRYDDSKIVNMFVGQLKSSLQCSVCGHRSVTFDPFWDLSLPIPSRSGQVKLSQCLELFNKEEVLDGDERPTCAKCKERRKMTKSFCIQKFPKVLVLHLKRFSPHERWRGKLTCMVEFPLDSLDLSRYAACSSISSHYKLIGVANHSGTALSGHYTAYCKHPYLKTWHEYNDSRVSTISQTRVCSAEAYVLFYELMSC